MTGPAPRASRDAGPVARAEARRSVRGVVLLHDLGRDPAALAHLEPLLLRPRTDGLVLLAVGGGAAGATTGPGVTSGGSASLPGHPDVCGERVPQLLGILAREVDLVGRAV